MSRAWLSFALGVIAGCGSAAPAVETAPPRPSDPTAAWQATLDRDHPLVGRIWDSAGSRFIETDELIDRVADEPRLALGERHDHPDHHRLQAYVLERLAARGRKPALVFEMLDASAQPAVDRARTEHPDDPDAIARAVDWEHSGWPPFALYRPLFALAVRGRWPIVAAGVPRDEAMQLARTKGESLDPQLAQRFALDRPLPPTQHAALRAEMRDAHCGMMPDAMLDAMVLIQRVRDARLAQALHDAAGRADGAVLIAGNGHVREDRGAPAALKAAFGERAVAIATQEVEVGATEAAAYGETYGAQQPPFDYVWFTPRGNDEDPCEALRKAHAHE